MLVEFIIDKDDYKKSIKKISFTASNGIEVSKRSLKANGKENYYFKITCQNENVESAKALSEIRCFIESEFKTDGIDDYRILTDESSQYFTKALYPLIMEFETKLRKFIHNTLFDISEISAQRVVAQLISALNIDKQSKEIPKFDFLELATLESIYLFLFQNNALYGDIHNYIANKKNRCATKKELIEYISNNEIDTIWNDLFEKNFSDSLLPKAFEDIIGIRNDVMHFHYISFTRYNEGVKLVKAVIQDLDKQIKKGIVIENTAQNIEKLSNNMGYQQSVLLGLQGLDEIQRLINNPLIYSTVDSVSPISKILQDISRNTILPTWNSEFSDIISPLTATMLGLPKLDGLSVVSSKLSSIPSTLFPSTRSIPLQKNDSNSNKGK